jgi:hypothetical protein
MHRFVSLPIILTTLVACGDEEVDPLEVELDRVRAAVERYHDLGATEADGFVPIGGCVELPQGAMGIHYLSPVRLQQPLDPVSPAILIYLPDGDGVRLVGVEYAQLIVQDGAPYVGEAPPRAESMGRPPVLFADHPFDGPMAGHEEGMPWHYDQHVWLFEDNPAGTFMPYHPGLRCE